MEEGTANADKIFLQVTNGPITVGTTSQTWTLLSSGGTTYTGGTGISVVGGVISLATPVSVANGGTNATTAAGARTSLGAVGKFATDIVGNGTATQFTVTHNFGTTDVQAQLWDATTNDLVYADMFRIDSNTVRYDFAVAPVNAKTYRAVVQG